MPKFETLANLLVLENLYICNTFFLPALLFHKFADKGVGTIIFGTVSGGFGAELAGGNFWKGAATGLIVSGLNHAMHNWPKNSKGEVYNFFNKDDDPRAYESAENYNPKDNEIAIFSHGGIDIIEGPDGTYWNANDVHEFLLKNSKLYNSNKTISIELKSCYTGFEWQFGFALTLSNLRPNTFVTGPNTYWWSDHTLDIGGKWNTYLNGSLHSQSIFDHYKHKYLK